MKRITIFTLLLICPSVLFTQPAAEPAGYAHHFSMFVNDFNTRNCQSITGHATETFSKDLSPAEAAEFIGGLRGDFGNIQSYRFKYFDRKNAAVYHAGLDRTCSNFYVRPDENNQLTRLAVMDPNYKEDLTLIENKTTMRPPYAGTWSVFRGGDTENENYHVTVRSQKNAFDPVIRDSTNQCFGGDGMRYEDYYAFGQKLYAPCSGTVITVIDSVADNVPGEMNSARLTGNSVIIQTKHNEYVLMAHFRNQSIAV